ncbi:MAG: hypothetical protein ABJB66_01420 [Gemmatimonadaceae bacterium]
MICTLKLRGVAVATIDLAFDDDGVGGIGDLTLLPKSDNFERVVRDGARASANHGYLPEPGEFTGNVTDAGEAAGKSAINRLLTLSKHLELQDDNGKPLEVNTMFHLKNDGGKTIEIVVFSKNFGL